MDSIGTVINTVAMTDERNRIGSRVRALRERAGWSQLELSRRSGVRQPTLSDIETGQTPSPQGSTLAKIAAALVVPVESLLGTAPIPGAPPPMILDTNVLVRALFRAYDDARHAPSQFDAARRAVLEAGSDLPQDAPDELAMRLLDAAATLASEGQPITSLALVTRALAARPAAKRKS